MSFDGPIEDRLTTRELYGAYSDATMRQDRSLYLSLWCEDGVRIAADGELTGKPAIAQHWDGIWSMLRQMGFFAEIDVPPATPSMRNNWQLKINHRAYCRSSIRLSWDQIGANKWRCSVRLPDLMPRGGRSCRLAIFQMLDSDELVRLDSPEKQIPRA